MKLIKTYIRLDMFEDIRRALNKEGYTSMTVMEAEGMGSYSDPENGSQDSTRMKKSEG